MTILALLGPRALWLLFAWLINTIICQYLSERKGYGQRWGLATGLIFPPGVIVWVFIPAKPESDWKVVGPFGGKSIDPDEAIDPAAERPPVGGAGPTGAAS
jgi:hypothetical protein